MMCPAGSGPGQEVELSLTGPVLEQQLLSIVIPEGAVGGQIIPVGLPSGGAMSIQLPPDATPGMTVSVSQGNTRLIAFLWPLGNRAPKLAVSPVLVQVTANTVQLK